MTKPAKKSPWSLYAPETKSEKLRREKLTEAITKAVASAVKAVRNGATVEDAHEKHVMPVLVRGEKFGATDTVVREETFAAIEKTVKAIKATMSPEFADTEFMSAIEKKRVLKAWVAFLKSGLSFSKFTEELYKHIHLHCAFIAHYDRGGFWNFYFAAPAKQTLDFIDQFDPELPGYSAEEGGQHWLRSEDYGDVNQAMREAARPFVGKLREAAKTAERDRDLALARSLLAKHGEKA